MRRNTEERRCSVLPLARLPVPLFRQDPENRGLLQVFHGVAGGFRRGVGLARQQEKQGDPSRNQKSRGTRNTDSLPLDIWTKKKKTI